MNNHIQQMDAAAARIDELLYYTSKAHCAYLIMDQDYMSLLAYPELSSDNRGHTLFVGDAYMVVTCANGYMYYINVSGDGVLTACAEVFAFVQYKL